MIWSSDGRRTEADKYLETVKIACQTVLMQGLGAVHPLWVVFAETCTVRLRSRVSEQVDAVKETWVTVAVVLYLVYGSARVLKVQPKNRLLRLFGVKLLLTMSVWVVCVCVLWWTADVSRVCACLSPSNCWHRNQYRVSLVRYNRMDTALTFILYRIPCDEKNTESSGHVY